MRPIVDLTKSYEYAWRQKWRRRHGSRFDIVGPLWFLRIEFPACRECGAIVAWGQEDRHTASHAEWLMWADQIFGAITHTVPPRRNPRPE